MYKLITNSAMPKWLKVLLNILLTITIIYWLCYSIYKLLDFIRIFLHWASDKRNWWTFLMCLFILGIGSLLLAQFVFGLNPFGKTVQWFIDIFYNTRKIVGGKIAG